jgi:hypothetical protein
MLVFFLHFFAYVRQKLFFKRYVYLIVYARLDNYWKNSFCKCPYFFHEKLYNLETPFFKLPDWEGQIVYYRRL